MRSSVRASSGCFSTSPWRQPLPSFWKMRLESGKFREVAIVGERARLRPIELEASSRKSIAGATTCFSVELAEFLLRVTPCL